jgi:hypothetical protein
MVLDRRRRDLVAAAERDVLDDEAVARVAAR